MSQHSTGLSADERKRGGTAAFAPAAPFIPDPLDQWVWGCAAIARIINRSERQTYFLAEGGHIDVEKVAGKWRSTPRRLLAAKSASAA
jgi:hypothetical protein